MFLRNYECYRTTCLARGPQTANGNNWVTLKYEIHSSTEEVNFRIPLSLHTKHPKITTLKWSASNCIDQL